MASALFSRGGTVSPTVAEDFFILCRPFVDLCAEKEGISCIGLYLNLSAVELYEMESERNYAMVLARHRIDLLAISVT